MKNFKQWMLMAALAATVLLTAGCFRPSGEDVVYLAPLVTDANGVTAPECGSEEATNPVEIGENWINIDYTNEWNAETRRQFVHHDLPWWSRVPDDRPEDVAFWKEWRSKMPCRFRFLGYFPDLWRFNNGGIYFDGDPKDFGVGSPGTRRTPGMPEGMDPWPSLRSWEQPDRTTHHALLNSDVYYGLNNIWVSFGNDRYACAGDNTKCNRAAWHDGNGRFIRNIGYVNMEMRKYLWDHCDRELVQDGRYWQFHC